MKKFKIRATHFEYLYEQEIEANSSTEAREKYEELWEDGEVLVGNSEVGNFIIEEIK